MHGHHSPGGLQLFVSIYSITLNHFHLADTPL